MRLECARERAAGIGTIREYALHRDPPASPKMFRVVARRAMRAST